MPLTLAEYADRLDARDLLWPEVPLAEPVKATPFTMPLAGIKAVTFDVYGTLLRITGGRLTLDGPDRLALQVAFEKTIEEFNVWNHLFRKPGPAWRQVYDQYARLLENRRMAATARAGDLPEIDAARDLWRPLIAQWDRKEFRYDEATYGDRDALAEKIAYFFASRLQGVCAAPHAAEMLIDLASAGLRVGLLSDGQSFTLIQLRRAFAAAGMPEAFAAIDSSCCVMSYSEGVRKPSPSLYKHSIKQFAQPGIRPDQILHVGSRLREDLGPAKRFRMRTALYAGDAAGFEATKGDVRNPTLAPDRLLTDLSQLREVVGIG